MRRKANFRKCVLMPLGAGYCLLKAAFSIQTAGYVTTLPISNVERLRTAVKLDYVWLQIYLTAQSSQINRTPLPSRMLKQRRVQHTSTPSSRRFVGQSHAWRSETKSSWFKAAFTPRILASILCLCSVFIGQECQAITTYEMDSEEKRRLKLNSGLKRSCGIPITLWNGPILQSVTGTSPTDTISTADTVWHTPSCRLCAGKSFNRQSVTMKLYKTIKECFQPRESERNYRKRLRWDRFWSPLSDIRLVYVKVGV